MEIEKLSNVIHDIHSRSPLIHHITNMVTVNDCANITLAFGGAPAMTDWREDALGMVEHAGALVLNMGVLTPESIETMVAVGQKARSLGIPVVFDPVGAGATEPRRRASKRILDAVRPDIVKGNAAEMMFLAGEDILQKGVDSSNSDGVEESVRRLAANFGVTAVATGITDYVSDGEVVYRVEGGCSMMGRITGTGCMSASVLGCFAAVVPSKLEAAVIGILAMNLAGEKAGDSLAEFEGSGTFRTRLIDAASLMDSKGLSHPERISHA